MRRILVAGVGNIFFSDDGFGAEVARRLAEAPPPDTIVCDVGIRAIHLAFELLTPFDLFVVADCMPRGGRPGTLYVVEPTVDSTGTTVGDAHGMNLPVVFTAVRELGGALPPTLIVGCEPGVTEPGIGLSESVEAAVPAAVELIRDLISSRQEAA